MSILSETKSLKNALARCSSYWTQLNCLGLLSTTRNMFKHEHKQCPWRISSTALGRELYVLPYFGNRQDGLRFRKAKTTPSHRQCFWSIKKECTWQRHITWMSTFIFLAHLGTQSRTVEWLHLVCKYRNLRNRNQTNKRKHFETFFVFSVSKLRLKCRVIWGRTSHLVTWLYLAFSQQLLKWRGQSDCEIGGWPLRRAHWFQL